MGVKRRLSGRAHADRPYRCSTSKRISQNKSALLETINGFYAAALDRLPVDEMPALVPRLLKAGLCVGFADPVSNIIVNTVSSYSRSPQVTSVSDEKTARRRRRKALSRAACVSGTGKGKVNYWPPPRFLLPDMSIAERSLVALVTFLTYYFRALPGWEALEYLRLAKADLLCAVRLVEDDLNSIGVFSFGSRTTKTALMCAAVAACHPKPRALVNRSYSLASRMEQLGQLLTTQGGCLSCTAIQNINGLLMKPHHKLGSLVGVTPPEQFLLEKNNNNKEPFVLTKSLQSTLLHRIYGFYIQALAALPTDGLRMFYHRSLLKAGHCYGPLMNPASNVVLSTLWYKAMFPPQGELPVTVMICSRSLVLVARRSLRGLVAYIRTCFPIMSQHQAMRYLLKTNVNLWGAIKMARQQGHAKRAMSSQYSAYKAAATAAQHPDPHAVADFFVSTSQLMPLDAFVVEDTDGIVRYVNDLEFIEHLLSRLCSRPNGSVQTVPVLSAGGSNYLSCILKDVKEEESFVYRKVNAMLKKYTQQTGGPEYELHVICGLNSNVGDGRVFGIHYGPLLSWRPRKTQFSHINFLARQRDLHSSDTSPELFFAECSNEEDATDDLSCWPVSADTGPCYYCENEGAMILHPDLERYIGSDTAFESMACDCDMTVGSICDNEFIINSVDVREEDCIYFDASRDAKCAKFLNARARAMQGPRLV